MSWNAPKPRFGIKLILFLSTYSIFLYNINIDGFCGGKELLNNIYELKQCKINDQQNSDLIKNKHAPSKTFDEL